MKVALKLCILSRIFRCPVTTTAIFSNVQSKTRQYGYISIKAHHRVLKLFLDSTGYVGGSHYSIEGGGSNYVCLTRDPIYAKHHSGGHCSRIYGAEYQTFSYGIYPSSLHDHDVPCAACHVTTRASQMMIPGRNVCPAGWTREYKGYLMAAHYDHHRTMYTCMDENPDYTRGTHANVDGALFYFVVGVCGSLPCKPYIAGHELTCAVCTR